MADGVRPYAELDLDRECIWIHLTEAQAIDLASGYVCGAVKSVIRELLDYQAENERRAARPVKVEKAKKAK